MAIVSSLTVDQESRGYTFKQDESNGNTLIFVRIRTDHSWNSSAYRKFFHKGSKDEDLDLNKIWYRDNTKRYINTKNVDLGKFFDNDRLKYFETYYPSQPNKYELLVLGFVSQSGKKIYFSRTDLKLTEPNEFKFSSFKPDGEKELLDKLYKENHTQNKVLTIKIDGISSYHNVEVEKGNLSDTEEFHKYIHTPIDSATSHENSVLDCRYKCEFKDFKPGDYTNTNLQEVAVYFNKGDTDTRVPLLIEFKPNVGQKFSGSSSNDQSVYYELKSLDEKKLEGNKSEWTRGFEKVVSVINIGERLNEIYNVNLKKQIDKIIGDNSMVIKAVSGTVGTIGAIGTGVGGFFIYKNAALVVTFLKSLF